MIEIINKIKNLTLKQINKILLIIALLSLIYRNGSFALSFPNPFEVIFVLICVLTLIDLIKNKGIKDFFISIPKRILIASICLVFSILLGWIIAIFFKNIPSTFNNILEFGGFAIGLGVFILILFYTQNDKKYARKLFYPLLLPSLFVIFIIFSGLAYYLNIANGSTFLGFTYNPNIISKILLIPSIFFITNSLFESKNKWLKIGYIIMSAAMVALLLWVASRAALVALALGSLLVLFVYSLHNFNWKKLIYNVAILFAIVLLGLVITPNSGKQVFVDKFLNPSDSNFTYSNLEDKSAKGIFSKFISTFMTKTITSNTNTTTPVIIIDASKEPRFKNWPLYLSKIIKNPLGLGPNTHMNIANTGDQAIVLGPHNTYLDIWLWGGMLGLFSFLYILFSSFKNLKIKLKSDFEPMGVALLGILFALSIAIFFNDSLQIYEFWIILALSLSYGKTTNN